MQFSECSVKKRIADKNKGCRRKCDKREFYACSEHNENDSRNGNGVGYKVGETVNKEPINIVGVTGYALH